MDMQHDTFPAIAHLSFSGDFGGREKVAVSLQRGMLRAGYDCFLYMIVEERLGPDRNENLLRSLGEKNGNWRFFRTDRRFSRVLLKEIGTSLREDGVRIVHCHCYKSLFYAHLLRALGMTKAAVFYTLHGLVLRPGWSSSFIKGTQTVGLRLCDGVIGCSKEILESNIAPGWAGKTAAIINAIEPPAEDYEDIGRMKVAARRRLVEQYGLDADKPIVINVGRLCPQKNFPLYFRLVERFLRESPNGTEANYLLLGNGALEEELREEARRLGVDDKVVFTGFVPDMAGVFTGADLLVQTSIWEGTPMCLLEANSFGLPAVVPDVGGNGDVVDDGGNGALFPVGDLDTLAEKTRAYLEDPSLREKHGRKAFERVRRDFNIADWVRRHVDFYADVVGRKA